jgi:WD40 repeat protein
VIELAFSPDSRRLASAGLEGLGALWDLESGQMMTLTHEGEQLFDVTFSPDGSRVTTVSQVTAEEKGVYEWDADTGVLLGMLPVERTKAVYTARYSPDGEQIAAGIQEGDVLVWDAVSGELVWRMTGHTGLVGRVAFSPDGKYLMSASKDNTVKLWDLSTGEEMQTLYGQTGALNWGIFSPDGTSIITTAVDGTVRSFVVSTERLVELARSRLSRSLTTEECQKYLHVEECPVKP